MAQRDELRRPLGRLDAGDAGGREDVPLRDRPAAIARTVSPVVRTRALATARLAVSALSPTPTMRASPEEPRCVSDGTVRVAPTISS